MITHDPYPSIINPCKYECENMYRVATLQDGPAFQQAIMALNDLIMKLHTFTATPKLLARKIDEGLQLLPPEINTQPTKP